jgi:hypothetical protein
VIGKSCFLVIMFLWFNIQQLPLLQKCSFLTLAWNCYCLSVHFENVFVIGTK